MASFINNVSAQIADLIAGGEKPYTMPDGSRWWCVGENASHSFYVGFFPDGWLGRAAYGDDRIAEGSDEDFVLDTWVLYRESDARFRRRNGYDFGRSGLSVENGRLVRWYWAGHWSQSRIAEDTVVYAGR